MGGWDMREGEVYKKNRVYKERGPDINIKR